MNNDEFSKTIEELQRKLDRMKDTGPEWWNMKYKRPLVWECPTCEAILSKAKLAWNYLLGENVCPRCGHPQRQHAIPGSTKAP